MNHAVGFLLFLSLFASAPVLRAFPEAFPVTMRYDQTSDTTTARMELLSEEHAAVRLTLQVEATFRGREPNDTSRFWFQLSVTQGHVSRKTPPLLDAHGTLHFWLDESQLEAPLTEYRREYYERIQRVSEAAHIVIERSDLPRLLAVRQLSGQHGQVKFKLSDAALAALKEFITRQVAITQAQ